MKPKPKRPSPAEIKLLALIAYRSGEISEGRCVELTGISRTAIRDEMNKRVGRYAPYTEVCDELDGLKKKCDTLIEAVTAAVIDHRGDCSANLYPPGKCDCGYAEVCNAVAAIKQQKG